MVGFHQIFHSSAHTIFCLYKGFECAYGQPLFFQFRYPMRVFFFGLCVLWSALYTVKVTFHICFTLQQTDAKSMFSCSAVIVSMDAENIKSGKFKNWNWSYEEIQCHLEFVIVGQGCLQGPDLYLILGGCRLSCFNPTGLSFFPGLLQASISSFFQ